LESFEEFIRNYEIPSKQIPVAVYLFIALFPEEELEQQQQKQETNPYRTPTEPIVLFPPRPLIF
jgi:hypothetical protein